MLLMLLVNSFSYLLCHRIAYHNSSIAIHNNKRKKIKEEEENMGSDQ